VTDRAIATYRRVARGGVGVLVTEGMRVHSTTAESRARGFLLFRKEIVPSLARMAQAVHDEGSLLIAQANHGGRQHQGANIPAIMWAPSAIACPHSGGVPHEMSKAEIADVGAGYVTAALNAQQAGCDGIEVHAAQGHLLMEFISPFSNQRTDEYGGSLENRMRFAVEIISTIREKAGPDFVIGLRLGMHEFTPGGIDVESSRLAVQHLLKLKAVDYFSLSQGNFNSIDTHLPDSHYGRLPFIDMQAQVREVAGGVPVVASGRIQTPEEAESILVEGKADFVGLCRALVADPEWPLKAKEGRSDDIVRCISTSECWGREGTATRAARLVCSINPTVGNELEWPTLGKADKPRRVTVVGGGPAGLEAARIAAERGHEVILFERKAALGGKLIGADRFAGYHDVSNAVNFLVRQTNTCGVRVRLGVEADAAAIAAEHPQTVILATGATVITPQLAGDGTIPTYAYEGDIPPDFPQGDVAVMD